MNHHIARGARRDFQPVENGDTGRNQRAEGAGEARDGRFAQQVAQDRQAEQQLVDLQLARGGLVIPVQGEDAEACGGNDRPPEVLEDVARADHDAGRQRQREVHGREHVLERRDHENEQHGHRDPRDREDHGRVDHRALHFAHDRVVLFQERREAQQNRVENTARLSGRHHVHKEIAERFRVFPERVGEGVTAFHVVHDLARDVGQDLVFGLLL